MVQPTNRAGNALSELLDQGLATAIGADLGPDPQAGEGLHLGSRFGGVAIALHKLEIVVICLALAR